MRRGRGERDRERESVAATYIFQSSVLTTLIVQLVAADTLYIRSLHRDTTARGRSLPMTIFGFLSTEEFGMGRKPSRSRAVSVRDVRNAKRETVSVCNQSDRATQYVRNMPLPLILHALAWLSHTTLPPTPILHSSLSTFLLLLPSLSVLRPLLPILFHFFVLVCRNQQQQTRLFASNVVLAAADSCWRRAPMAGRLDRV